MIKSSSVFKETMKPVKGFEVHCKKCQKIIKILHLFGFYCSLVSFGRNCAVFHSHLCLTTLCMCNGE